MNTVTIGTTTKGRRVWLQGIRARMPDAAGHYDVTYTDSAIVVHFSATGKRKVTHASGGIVDIEGLKCATWARSATMAHVGYGIHHITITRAN